MAEEEPEELPPCLWETKNEEGEWGEGATDEGFPVGEVRFRRPPSNCRAFQKRASPPPPLTVPDADRSLPETQGRMTFPNGDVFEGTYVKSMIPDPVAVAEAEAAAAEKAAAEAEAAAAAADAPEGEAPAEGDAPAEAAEEPEPEIPLIPISMRQGKGRYVFKPTQEGEEHALSGGFYDGDFVDNKKHGAGEKTFPDGSKYVGAFAEDQIHGEGEYTYASGDVYRGAFEKGKKHGQGSYFFKASESTFMGRWSQGRFEEGEWVFSDGSSYVGLFENGKPKGEGTYTWSATGNTQTGEWGADGAFIGGPIKAGV
jgi:radial spoke head protein 1